jgi:P-type Cu+ transporter
MGEKKMEDLNLKLKGMSCSSCANSIEKSILNVPGVLEGNVNFSIDRASVRYDPKQTNINVNKTNEKSSNKVD